MHVCRLSDAVSEHFKKLAVAGPEVVSPSIAHTRLSLLDRDTDKPSPKTVTSKSQALEHPSKQGLTKYDRMMIDLEATVNKFLKQLDKDIQEAQEAQERERVLKERMNQRLQKKRIAGEAAAKKGKEAR